MREEMPSHLSRYTPHLDPEYHNPFFKASKRSTSLKLCSIATIVEKLLTNSSDLFQEVTPLAKEPQDEPEIDSNPVLEPEADLESQPTSETVSPEQGSMETVTVSLTKKKGNTCQQETCCKS